VTFKLLIIAILVLILLSLGSGLVFLISDKGQKTRTVKALTVRIALSLGLFVLLIVAYATGLITPHGVLPPAP
jgi:putative copper export protein